MDNLSPEVIPSTPAAPSDAVRHSIPLIEQLQRRVVREPARETWFIVNNSGEGISTIPVETQPGRSIRRVDVNGETAEFSSSPGMLMVRPRRELRDGAGTLVVVHFR